MLRTMRQTPTSRRPRQRLISPKTFPWRAAADVAAAPLLYFLRVKTFPATVNRTVVFGSACWVLSIVFFVSQAIAQAASARPFSLTTNLISDLGNTACGVDVCSPLHTFVNATFVFVGVLHVLVSALRRRRPAG